MGLKKNRFAETPKKKTDMALQITSMADIFTILLVFLLKSLGGGEASSPPNQGLTLPSVKSGNRLVEAVRLELSPTAIVIEGKHVASLSDFRFVGPEEQAIQTLEKAIQLQRSRQLTAGKAQDVDSLDKRMIIFVDRKTPYSALKKVMSVAATQGYTEFKLAVVKEDES